MQPVIVGCHTDINAGIDDGDDRNSEDESSVEGSLCAAKELFSNQPFGQTPLCRQIRLVIDNIQKIENLLILNKQIAIFIIMTDGVSTDGNVIETLKPLEGLPIRIIIRICTSDRAVAEYWHDINSKLDIDILVLDGIEETAYETNECNSWLTYSDCLHRVREYGVIIPAVEMLKYRPLNKIEMKTVIDIV